MIFASHYIAHGKGCFSPLFLVLFMFFCKGDRGLPLNIEFGYPNSVLGKTCQWLSLLFFDMKNANGFPDSEVCWRHDSIFYLAYFDGFTIKFFLSFSNM